MGTLSSNMFLDVFGYMIQSRKGHGSRSLVITEASTRGISCNKPVRYSLPVNDRRLRVLEDLGN